MITVKIYELEKNGLAIVGEFRFDGSRVIFSPPDSLLLRNMLSQPIYSVPERRLVGPHDDPEAWLKALQNHYRSPYLCAGPPEGSAPKQKTMSAMGDSAGGALVPPPAFPKRKRTKVIAPAVKGLCVPNAAGPGHHDKETGHPCSPGGPKPPAARGQGRGAETPKESSRRRKVDRAKALLAKLGRGTIKAFAKAAGTAGHWEHAAKEWSKDKVGERVGKLPPKTQLAVRGVWAAVRLGSKALFASYTAGQALAEQVARQRGATPEQAARLRQILSAVDMTVAKPSVIVGEATGVGWVLGFVPVASLTYLAYALPTTHPLKTIRAARDAVKSMLEAEKKSVGGESAEALAARLLDKVKEHEGDEFWLAALYAALDRVKDLARAIEVADRVSASRR